MTYTEHFRFFINNRPAISPDRLAEELKFNRSNLHKIIHGNRTIPQARRGDFYRIMLKYGYRIPSNYDLT